MKNINIQIGLMILSGMLQAEILEVWNDKNMPDFKFNSSFSEETGDWIPDSGLFLTPLENTIFVFAKFKGINDGFEYKLNREVRYNYTNNEYEVYGKIGPEFSKLSRSLQQKNNNSNTHKSKKNFWGTWLIDEFKIEGENYFWHPHNMDIIAFQNAGDNDIYIYNYSNKSIIGSTPFYYIDAIRWSPLGDKICVYGIKYKGGEKHNYIFDTGLEKDSGYLADLIKKLDIVVDELGEARVTQIKTLMGVSK